MISPPTFRARARASAEAEAALTRAIEAQPDDEAERQFADRIGGAA